MSTSKTALSRFHIERALNNARAGGQTPIQLSEKAPRAWDTISAARHKFIPDMIGHDVPSGFSSGWSGAFNRQRKAWDVSQVNLKEALRQGMRKKHLLAGGAALGALGLGAGGYALYRHLKNKNQPQEVPKTAAEQGYQDALEKLGFFGPFKKKPIQSMQPFSMAGLPSEANSATDAVRAMYNQGGPSRIQQFESSMANRAAGAGPSIAQQAAASGIKAPQAMNIGSGIVPAAGEAVAAGAAKPGMLSGLGWKGKALGGLALAGGAAYLWNKHRQKQQMQQSVPQQYYGPPQQMPAMQGGY